MNYQTSDMYIGAYFLLLVDEGKLSLDSKLKDGMGRVWFMFSPYDVAERAEKDFINGNAVVTLKKYCDSLKTYKGLVLSMKYNTTRGGESHV